jgi:hypothetical protein
MVNSSLRFQNVGGITTGDCNRSVNYCELYAWCKLEDPLQNPPHNILQGVRNFSVFVRSTVKFPRVCHFFAIVTLCSMILYGLEVGNLVICLGIMPMELN